MVKIGGENYNLVTESSCTGFVGEGYIPGEWQLRKKGVLSNQHILNIGKSTTEIKNKGHGRYNILPIFKNGNEVYIPRTKLEGLLPVCRRQEIMGWINDIGLTGPGHKKVIEMMQVRLPCKNFKYAPSLYGKKDEILRMASNFADADIGKLYEAMGLNVSCPNECKMGFDDAEMIVDACLGVYAECEKPILLKLGVANDIGNTLETVINGTGNVVKYLGLNGIHIKTALPGVINPFASGGGSITGDIVHPQLQQFAARLMQIQKKSDVKIPIGIPVWHPRDIANVCEPNIPSVCSRAMLDPRIPIRFANLALANSGYR